MNISVYSGAGPVEVREGVPSETPPPLAPVTGQITVYAPACAGGVEVRTSAPPDPVDEPLPTVQTRWLNLTRVVCFETHSTVNRYDRNQKIVFVNGSAPKLTIVCCDFAAGGDGLPFLGTDYPVFARLPTQAESDAVAVGTMVPASSTAYKGTVTLDMSGFPQDCEVYLTIGVSPGETNPLCVGVRGAGDADNITTYFQSYNWTHGSVHKWMRGPRRLTPKAFPLLPRQRTPLVPGTSKTNLHLRTVVPRRGGNIFRPNVHPSGAWSTCNRQPYAWLQFVSSAPSVTLLDGPRGVGNVVFATDILIGRDGSYYVLDPWGLRHVSNAGHVTTKGGKRHNSPPSYWDDAQTLEFVGDWSEIEAAGEPVGFRIPWGMVWRPLSVTADGPPILNDRTGVVEASHVRDPQMLVADTKNNRILVGTADRSSHATPWKWTVLARNLPDAFGVAMDENDNVIVSVRKSHQIVMFPFTDPDNRTVLLQGAALALVDQHHEVQVLGTLTDRRATPCVAPEGLRYVNGWVTFGSKAQAQVRQFQIADPAGTLRTLFNPTTDNNTNFMQISASPDGLTIGVVTWGLFNHGFPEVWRLNSSGAWVKWAINASGDLPQGRGGLWSTWGYPSACAISADQIAFAGAHEGLGSVSMALPADPTHSVTAFRAAETEYAANHYNLTHGPGGYGYYGWPLPADPDVAPYLACYHEGEVAA